MGIEILKILEKNGELKISTFLNEYKKFIISLMISGYTYKEIVTILNEKAKNNDLNIRITLSQLTSFLNRKNLLKDKILKEYGDKKIEDLMVKDSMVKEKAVADENVSVFKNLIKK